MSYASYMPIDFLSRRGTIFCTPFTVAGKKVNFRVFYTVKPQFSKGISLWHCLVVRGITSESSQAELTSMTSVFSTSPKVTGRFLTCLWCGEQDVFDDSAQFNPAKNEVLEFSK
jgi:hypothetical protein